MLKPGLVSRSILVLLPACSSRPETPEYVKALTGLDLCPEAAVRNVGTPPENEPGSGFIYIVDVRMNGRCVDRVKRQLEERRAAGRPGLPPGGGEFLGIVDIEEGVRITYTG